MKHDTTADEQKPGQTMRPCRYCGGQAPRETLSTLGARCLPCYREFCRTGKTLVTRQEPPPHWGDQA